MKLTSGLSAAAISLVLATSGQAETTPLPIIGATVGGGSGCSIDDTQVVATDDQLKVSFLFDNYRAMTKGDFDLKDCNVAITMKIPKGFSYSIFRRLSR